MSYEIFLTAAGISLVCLAVNIPFGMLRSRFVSYSLLWFLCIHAPIPVSAVMRKAAGLGWKYAALFLIFGIAGQIIGKKTALRYFPPK